MITFLIITTVVNLALGYALAVYLGDASLWPKRELGVGLEEQSPAVQTPAAAAARSGAAFPESIYSTMQAATAAAAMQDAEPAAKAKAVAKEEPAEESEQGRSAEMEQDLLAGIEEFRNQLAQLKGQNFDDVLPSSLPESLAVGAR